MNAMRDKFRFVVTDAAEAIVLHEALMSMRNRTDDWPSDVLRAEAADRLLASLDYATRELADIRRHEAEAPAEYARLHERTEPRDPEPIVNETESGFARRRELVANAHAELDVEHDWLMRVHGGRHLRDDTDEHCPECWAAAAPKEEPR